MSKQETAGVIRKALDDARSGSATLSQLGTAHDLAASAGLTGCVGELRQHIAHLASPNAVSGRPRPRSLDLVGDVVAGVISGYFTHHLIS
jgi:hypothetical protein